QNLAAGRGVTKTAGYDNGSAEIAAIAPEYLTEMYPDFHLEAGACTRRTRGLLHGDGAAHRVGRRRERGQYSVPQPFQLRSASGFDRGTQQPMVNPEKPIRSLVALSLQVFGGADQVGEKDCKGLCLEHRITFEHASIDQLAQLH